MGDYPKPGFHDPDLINAGKVFFFHILKKKM